MSGVVLRPLPVIFNSLTGARHPFRCHSSPFLWYICGPTVYDDAHLGHARTYVCFDIIRRVMRDVFGLDSILAMGVTDIDDKIIARARAERRPPASIAEQYEASFTSSMQALGVAMPDHVLRVSEHIDDIVDCIGRIQRNGFATINDRGDVAFDTKRFHASPGRFRPPPAALPLSLRRPSAGVVVAGHRYGKLQPANFGAERRDSDFALWKAGDEPGACWDSPWGRGRPGWHIECSAMASSVFGPRLDVHGGGIDVLSDARRPPPADFDRQLRFPHHNNEIAQSEALFGVADWALQWWHTGHLHIDGLKMSKSLKNFVTVDRFLRDHGADQFRVFCLLHRYRSTVHYSADRVRDAARVLRSFDEIDRRLCGLLQNPQRGSMKPSPASMAVRHLFAETKQRVITALADDFDTPTAMSCLLQLINRAHHYMDEAGDAAADRPLLANIAAYLRAQLTLFGVRNVHGRRAESTNPSHGAVQVLVDFRSRVRQEALRATSTADAGLARRLLSECDQVRDRLASQAGVQIQDHRDRPSSWSASSTV